MREHLARKIAIFAAIILISTFQFADSRFKSFVFPLYAQSSRSDNDKDSSKIEESQKEESSPSSEKVNSKKDKSKEKAKSGSGSDKEEKPESAENKKDESKSKPWSRKSEKPDSKPTSTEPDQPEMKSPKEESASDKENKTIRNWMGNPVDINKKPKPPSNGYINDNDWRKKLRDKSISERRSKTHYEKYRDFYGRYRDPYYYSPYDRRFYDYLPRHFDSYSSSSILSERRRAEKYYDFNDGDSYYLRLRSDWEKALYNIRRAWLDGDIALMSLHISDKMPVRIYHKGRYAYRASPREFFEMTYDALDQLYTHDFSWLEYRHNSRSIFAEAKHVYESPNGKIRVNYISYTLEKEGRHWIITEVDNAPESGDAKCFIATAAYGTPMDGNVLVLRQFRDEILMKSKSGKMLIKAYYRLSPPAARIIDKQPALRFLARLILKPVVKICKNAIQN